MPRNREWGGEEKQNGRLVIRYGILTEDIGHMGEVKRGKNHKCQSDK